MGQSIFLVFLNDLRIHPKQNPGCNLLETEPTTKTTKGYIVEVYQRLEVNTRSPERSFLTGFEV